ncbi:MAG: hypothetical protein EZS28_019032 [Streblomastix strix]|uniref:C2 domain-containing protein n=1 Tax=Streblomastix strix TaxID=222440 RepID=A0A5J4VSA4_9EUKA|nr:MAG: hypothetical protein EZS28_019032 [Streblomastix strix]
MQKPRTSSRSFAGEDGKPGISELEKQSRIYEEEEGQIKDMTKYQKGKVCVRIVGVRDIDPINEGQQTDIFVLMKFQGEEMKTSTVNNNLNALFHEEFRFDFDPQNTEEKNILFELWDSDNVTKHDFLGEIKTRLGSYKDSPLFLELDIYGFDERSDKVVGVLDVEIEYQISQNDEDNSTQFDTVSVNQQPIKYSQIDEEGQEDAQQANDKEIGKKSVIINLIGVKNVAAMDTNRKSDANIKIIFDGQLIGRTKKVADTVNAEYNEEFNFEFDPEATTERKLLLELWDHDTLSDDDQIGKVQQIKIPSMGMQKSSTDRLLHHPVQGNLTLCNIDFNFSVISNPDPKITPELSSIQLIKDLNVSVMLTLHQSIEQERGRTNIGVIVGASVGSNKQRNQLFQEEKLSLLTRNSYRSL